MPTWTFIGHWENGTIVVEEVREGVHQDDRVEDYIWPEGFFAAAASGATAKEAEAAMRDEYETWPR